MNELDKVIDDISARTGITVRYYTQADAFGCTYDGERCIKNFEDVLADERLGVTFFKFTFKGVKCTGVINGTGNTEYNYCVILSELLKNSCHRQVPNNRSDALRSILSGRASNEETTKFYLKSDFPDSSCYVILVNSEGNSSEIEQILSHAGTVKHDSVVHIDGDYCAVIKFCLNDSDYQSAADYAGFLSGAIEEEMGIQPLIGVGNVVENFCDIALSYFQARTAIRMCRTLESKGSVHTYKEYLLVRMLDDVPPVRRREYLKAFMNDEVKKLLADEDMSSTAEEFLQNNLNVSETSRKLFMHRNTLMYRLDKIERVTGMDIRKFSDATSFRVLTILYKLLG